MRDDVVRSGVHVGPGSDPETEAAVRRAGAQVVDLAAADAIVWVDSNPASFPRSLPDTVRWIQLPAAGVETWVAAGLLDPARLWTTAVGAYAETVAEHALMLLLAGLRQLPTYLAATAWPANRSCVPMQSLHGAEVAIVGCGGIGRALIPGLRSLGAEVLAVTRGGRPVEGARQTLPAARTGEVWSRADHFVLAAPATAATRHLVGPAELAQLKPSAWLVNVGRGVLVDTAALVRALAEGQIGGAALDVVDPEPLPRAHPLWSEPRAIITPHVANPRSALRPSFLRRVMDNTVRFVEGMPLVGVIDLQAGY
jgi:phosphoglycerate dehydrogenase-like enzyme